MYSGLLVSTFKDRFAELFAESEKTITALAKDLHVSYQTISAWKTGTRSPKEPTVIAIADFFGVSVPWLLGFDVEKEAPKPKTAIVIPDSQLFQKIAHYMTTADYETVMGIFDKTYKKMKEMGIE